MRGPVLISALLLGCVPVSGDPAASESSGSSESTTSSEFTSGIESTSGSEATSTSDESTTDADTGDTTGEEVPPCEPNACEQACGQAQDECGFALGGECLDDACVCASQLNCLPCVPEDCPPYASCTAAYTQNGMCAVSCSYGFPQMQWSPETGCTVHLLRDPVVLMNYAQFLHGHIGDTPLPIVGNCDNPQLQFAAWLSGGTDLVLCAEACAQFEMGATLSLGWTLPCD